MNAKQVKRLRKQIGYRGAPRSLIHTLMPETATFIPDDDYARLVAEETGHAVLNAQQALHADVQLPLPKDGELLRVRWGPMINAPGTARSTYQRRKRGCR